MPKELEKEIGKEYKVLVKQLTKSKKYFITINPNHDIIYVRNESEFPEEKVNTYIDCRVITIIEDKLLGIEIGKTKFVTEMRKIKKSKEEKQEEVKDIVLLKKIYDKGKILGLYQVEENNIFKYFLGMQEIGVFSPKVMTDNILFKQNTLENEMKAQIKEVLNGMQEKENQISLKMEEQKNIEELAKVLEIENNRQITRIAEIDLKQEVGGKRKQNNTLDMRQQQPIENQEKDIQIKQELEFKDKTTDMKTLGQMLEASGKMPQKEGKEYVKLGVVESDEIDNLKDEKGKSIKGNTTRYQFVAIAKDGTVEPVKLEQDHQEGDNPRETNYQVKQNGKVQRGDVLSRYKIGNGTLALENGKYGEIKAFHSPEKTIGGKGIEGNKSLDRELETNNVWEMKKQERDLAGEYDTGYRGVERQYQEAMQHDDTCEKMEISDVDGDLNTKSHIHQEHIDYTNLAVKWGYYDEGMPNVQKAKEVFEEKRKENPQKETKEIIEMVTEELEEQIGRTQR